MVAKVQEESNFGKPQMIFVRFVEDDRDDNEITSAYETCLLGMIATYMAAGALQAC